MAMERLQAAVAAVLANSFKMHEVSLKHGYMRRSRP
jgi:hypothetical protein